MFPFAAHKNPGAEAVTQFGQTGQGLIPSLMDSRSALAWLALPAPSSIACEYTLCAVNNATHLQGLGKDMAPVCITRHLHGVPKLQVSVVHKQLH